MYLGLKQSRNNTTVDILENFNKVYGLDFKRDKKKKKKLNLQYIAYYQSVNILPFVFGKHLI